jgi:signal peptidase I
VTVPDPDRGPDVSESFEGIDRTAADSASPDSSTLEPSVPEAEQEATDSSRAGPSDPWAPLGVDADETAEAISRLRDDARTRGEKRDATRSFWRELPFLILVALIVAIVIKTFLVQAFFIPSASMNPTLVEGDRVMVNKLAYRFGDPARGDVIVFDNPLQPDDGEESVLAALVRHVAESLGISSPDTALIKRVVAVGGETIEISGGVVLIDGEPIEEPYLPATAEMRDFGPFEVPSGHVFVMGDNRGASQDSRRFGAIPEDEIIGRAFVKVWPPSRWGGL